MGISNGLVSELKIADVLTFLTVQRCGSISGAARELMVTPSQVSKTIGRLEELLGASLLSRSANGVTLLDEGRRVVPQFEQMLDLARSLRGHTAGAPRVLGFAAPSYMAAFFLPLVAALEPTFRIRVLELPPAQIRAHLSTGHFDVALSIGEMPLATSWESTFAGDLEKGVFCSPATAKLLGEGPIDKARLTDLPLISPVYLTDAGFLPIEDDCPLSRRDRKVGHETTTFAMGLALATRTNQLVYGPVIGALPFLEAGLVVKLEVQGWESSRDAMHVACNTERITRTEQRMLVSVISSGLASLRY